MGFIYADIAFGCFNLLRFYEYAVYISHIDAALQSQTQDKIGLLLVQYVQFNPFIRTIPL